MPNKTLTKNDRLAFLLRKTIADYVATEVKDERGDIFDDLLTKFTEDGVKQLSVTLPDGEAIATLTVTQPKPKTSYSDMDALLEWVRESDPDAVEAVTTERISPAKLAELERYTEVVDGRHYTESGEEVPGMVTSTPAPSSFSVKYASGDASRDRIIQAWKQGELEELDTGKTVPQLSWTGAQQEDGE